METQLELGFLIVQSNNMNLDQLKIEVSKLQQHLDQFLVTDSAGTYHAFTRNDLSDQENELRTNESYNIFISHQNLIQDFVSNNDLPIFNSSWNINSVNRLNPNSKYLDQNELKDFKEIIMLRTNIRWMAYHSNHSIHIISLNKEITYNMGNYDDVGFWFKNTKSMKDFIKKYNLQIDSTNFMKKYKKAFKIVNFKNELGLP